MDVGEKEITVAAFILTWVAGIFRFGKQKGALVADVKKNSENIVTLQEATAQTESRFVTENNEPALMSFRAHNHICERNNELILTEFSHVVASVETQSKSIAELSKKLGDVATVLAVLEEKVRKR